MVQGAAARRHDELRDIYARKIETRLEDYLPERFDRQILGASDCEVHQDGSWNYATFIVCVKKDRPGGTR